MSDHYTFLKHVFPAELKSIRTRWVQNRRRSVPESAGDQPPLPSTKHRLVGLALSGGGIRSATFNLGILQGLHQIGVLPFVDYLSTVSGGGYIGGALSALTHRPGSPFPFDLEQRTPEPAALNHLRGNANYLMLGGAVDGVRMAMVILRGILINLMLVMPWCLFLTVITSLFYWTNLVTEEGEAIPLALDHFFKFSRYLAPAYLAFLLFSPVITRVQAAREAPNNPSSYWMRDFFERVVAYGILFVGGVAFIEALPLGVGLFHMARTEQSTVALAGAGSTLSVVGALLARQMGNAGASILERVGVVIASLLGPLLLIGIFVVLAEKLIYYNPDPYYLAETIWLGIGIALLIFNQLAVNVNQHSGHRFWRDRLSKAFLIAPNGDQLEHVDPLPLSQLAQPGSDAPYHLLNTTLNLQGDRDMVNRARYGDFFVFSKHFVGGDRSGYVPTRVMERVAPHVNLGTAMAISSAAAAPNMGIFTMSSLTLLMTLLNIRMGVWMAQPRRLVADLIARGWLDPQKELDEGGMTMPDFVSAWRWQAREPYLFREMMGMMHNEARMVNLSDGGHLENLGVYELLRRRCRYIIVGDGEADPTMQFGSLAALIRYARIDMGIQIDIDLADIRLGKEGAYGRQHAAVGTVYYPKVGEQPAEIGILLYFKASLTGDEDSMLAQYKSSSPSFPHESTADQFFSEAQFEAYRSLGNHVVTSLLRECLSARRVLTEGQGVDSFDALMAMFRRVRVLLSTQAQSEECLELQQQAELGRIMGEDGPNFAFDYYSELYPEVDDSNEDRANRLKTDPAYRRRMLEIVARQLSLMESIYLKLDLHHARNRELESYSRWINLFRGWACSPSFRWASTLHAPTMGPAFRVFCQDVLGLRWGLIWRKVEVEDRAWFAGKTDPNAILLVGSITVAGEPLCPTEDLACVSFVDQGGTLRLSTHALRHGFQGVDVYRLFLIGLGGLRVGRSPLLPQPRLFAAEISDLLPQYQNDVDAQDLLMEIRGSNAEP